MEESLSSLSKILLNYAPQNTTRRNIKRCDCTDSWGKINEQTCVAFMPSFKNTYTHETYAGNISFIFLIPVVEKN